MAKRSRGNARANQTAAQLGRLLGQVAARVDSWRAQRDAIRDDLGRIISTANDLMAELGGTVSRARRAARRSAARNVSPAARAKMAAAARRRWARFRAERAKNS